MILDNEFYYLVKVQVSDEALDIAERASIAPHTHAQEVGDALEMAIRQSLDLAPLVDNIDTRPLNTDADDLEEALILLTHALMIEEWDGNDQVLKFANHLDSIRSLYLSIKSVGR